MCLDNLTMNRAVADFQHQNLTNSIKVGNNKLFSIPVTWVLKWKYLFSCDQLYVLQRLTLISWKNRPQKLALN